MGPGGGRQPAHRRGLHDAGSAPRRGHGADDEAGPDDGWSARRGSAPAVRRRPGSRGRRGYQCRCGASATRCGRRCLAPRRGRARRDRKSTRLNSSHRTISYAVFCLKKKKKKKKKKQKQKKKK